MNRRSIVRGVQFIVGITLLTFAYLTFDSFRENPEGLRLGFSHVRPLWLILGAVLALQEGVCGGLRIWVLGRVLYPKLRARTAVISEFVLMFAAGVTPGQLGAAPSQVAVLMTGGMKFADVATVELLVASCTITFFLLSALVIFALREAGLFIVYGKVPIDWLLGVGVAGFGSGLVLLIFSAAYPPLAKGVVRAGSAVLSPIWHAILRLFTRFSRTRTWAEGSLSRKGDLRTRMMLTVDDFHHGFRIYMKRGKRAYLTAFLLTFGFFCSRFAVAYFVLLGLGLPTTPTAFVTVGPPLIQIILVQALLNFVLYLSPIPSAGGLAEASSRDLMSQWVKAPFDVPYVLVWRLLAQFLCMFVGGVYVFRFLGADVLESKVKEVEAEKRAHEDHTRPPPAAATPDLPDSPPPSSAPPSAPTEDPA
ncbi:MAG: lysylphosphatidylglycerol synthase transmembrane domain-containing protein [Polyangiaceae bacterium]